MHNNYYRLWTFDGYSNFCCPKWIFVGTSDFSKFFEVSGIIKKTRVRHVATTVTVVWWEIVYRFSFINFWWLFSLWPISSNWKTSNGIKIILEIIMKMKSSKYFCAKPYISFYRQQTQLMSNAQQYTWQKIPIATD